MGRAPGLGTEWCVSGLVNWWLGTGVKLMHQRTTKGLLDARATLYTTLGSKVSTWGDNIKPPTDIQAINLHSIRLFLFRARILDLDVQGNKQTSKTST